MLTKEQVYQIVFQICRENPEMVKAVIDAATEGVKAFAETQKDNSSKMAFMLCDILDQNNNLKTKYFPLKEINTKIAPFFKGTPGGQKLIEKYGINGKTQ